MRCRLIARKAVLPVSILVLIALLSFGLATRDVSLINRVVIRPLNRYEIGNNSNNQAGSVIHPIVSLINKAEENWRDTVDKQSKTLEQAVDEYQRRYQIPPPPNFDRWYEFATARNSLLVDEYDLIHELLTPFWGMTPAQIRARTIEGLGYPPDQNALWGVQIRNGSIEFMTENGWGYLKDLVPEMTKDFIKWLPDMDLAFNLPDEPRVVVPHEDLSQLVKTARNGAIPRARLNKAPLNHFSDNSSIYQDGFEAFHHTRFFQLQNQPMWQTSKLSCSPQSAARSLEESPRDDTSEHAFGELGFPSNETSMTDICNSPSLASTHGYFVMTCGTRITHDLIPVFSSSKMSSNQDILIPAPWYWMAFDDYKESTDPDWSAKNETFFWRGSTTGGQSQGGSWRYQHRQRVVKTLQLSEGEGQILAQAETETGDVVWVPQNISRAVYKHHMDVGFTNIVQCDDDDCKEQEAAFGLKESRTREEGWTHRHLLDMDGNAFSGRFLTLLRSKSLVYKVGVFREWTNEWLWPWIHYIPLSLRFADGGDGDAGSDIGGMGSDWLETIRFFTNDPVGWEEAERLAMLKREWVAKTMRKEDMEVWFFRLLLE
ncbi:hypothetical protein RRF57_003216 [Xylaria bambusicola]|uniref:Glycosyl transferase CAP10 domain-containing protein n=1 Tax=Xylaria bambusicola TaxID=326684 RepID=A0AAN7Z7F9_9PEZI